VKQYYCLSGAPRCGNTLFSTILNQNKNVYCSPNSIVADLMLDIIDKKNEEVFLNNPDHDSYDNVIKNIIVNYYQNHSQEIIIDRSLNWLSPTLFGENKVVVLVRPVLEILSSFLRLNNQNKDNYFTSIIKDDLKTHKFVSNFSEDDDVFCDWLMRNNGHIDMFLKNLRYSLVVDPEKTLVIDYNNFIRYPQETIEEVYKFLGINHYDHYFNNLNENCFKVSYDDSVYELDLHKIRTNKIERKSYDYHKSLSKNVIRKYENLEFWDKIPGCSFHPHPKNWWNLNF
jgi:hypothetical protein